MSNNPAPNRINDPVIPSYSFPLMLSVMEELGVSADLILKNTNLKLNEIRTKVLLLSYHQAMIFVSNLVKHSPRPDIGLYIGSRYKVTTFGNLGYAMMSSANWLDALQMATKYHKAASSLLQMESCLIQTGKTLAIRVEPPYPIGDFLPFTVEKLFASLVSVTLALLDQPMYPTSVQFSYQKPSYHKAYGDIYKCPVEFSRDTNIIQFDRELLMQPIPMANPVHARMGEELCIGFMAKHFIGDSLSHKIANMLLQRPGNFPGMEQIANELGMSLRTLRRNLKSQSTSYRAIADDARKKLAIEYLQTSSLNMEEIARLVGFTEATNFRRAFRKWTGKAPSNYRSKH